MSETDRAELKKTLSRCSFSLGGAIFSGVFGYILCSLDIGNSNQWVLKLPSVLWNPPIIMLIGIAAVALVAGFAFLHSYKLTLRMMSMMSEKDERELARRKVEGFLRAFTKALFVRDDDLMVCCILWICDEESKKRGMEYQYNAEVNMAENRFLDVDFGDVGRECFCNRKPLNKICSLDDWKHADENYQMNVPKNLRLIMARPIAEEDSGRIKGILEIDFFGSGEEGEYLGSSNTTPNALLKKYSDYRIQSAIALFAKALNDLISSPLNAPAMFTLNTTCAVETPDVEKTTE